MNLSNTLTVSAAATTYLKDDVNRTNTTTTTTPSLNATIPASHVYTAFTAFSKETTVFYYCAFSVMFVVGSIGNSVVIYVIAVKGRLRTNFDIYIVSLAIADLLASVFLPVVMIHDLYTVFNHWHLAGNLGCKLLVPMPHINSLVSALMLVVISFDRLRVIKQTSLIKRSKRITLVEVMSVWVVSILVVSPYMYVLKVERGYCVDRWKKTYRFTYYVVLQIFSCVIPVIVMVVTYTYSARVLLHKNIPGMSGNSFRRRRRKQNQRVTQMFGIIVVIFFVMTTPYLVSFFVIGYYGTFEEQTYIKMENLLFNLQYAFYTLMGFNSNINPFIYAVRYKDISKLIKRFLSTQRHDKIKRKVGVVQMAERKYGVVIAQRQELLVDDDERAHCSEGS